jgi:flagellar FliL protein
MSTATDTRAATDASTVRQKKKPGKKRVVIIAVVVAVVAGGTYKFVLSPSKPASATGAAATKPAAQPGPLVPTDAVTVNLAGGHYLRIALAMQFTSKVSKTALPDTSAALDQIISYLTGQPADQLNTPSGLASVKAALTTRIAAAYPKDPLLDVLITSYVIQ